MTPEDRLPARIMPARVFRVHTHELVELDIDVGFGITTRRRVNVEGIDRYSVPPDLRQPAFHCMVVILGGRTSVLVQTDDFRNDGVILARLFLDSVVVEPPPGTQLIPKGMANPRVEVSNLYNWCGKQRYAVEPLLRVINGDRPLPNDLLKRAYPPAERATVAARQRQQQQQSAAVG